MNFASRKFDETSASSLTTAARALKRLLWIKGWQQWMSLKKHP
jgi:hypothetical protein